ncbi:MAG: GIY-YIG nuclease family protein, partial [Phycisphaerales bacterium]|nr:GIY-YIG nuclease family protein [Phycisphaerales bacterium]
MPRQTTLVCQYLENISQEALDNYQDIIRDYIRGRHGVYALYRKGKLYYVGLAGNLRGRLRQHLRDRHGTSWDRFSVYLTIGNSHLRELESLLLRIVRPKGNKQRGKFHRSCENLRNRFSRDVRDSQRQELNELLGRPQVEEEEVDSTTTRATRRRSRLAELVHKPIRLRGRHKGKCNCLPSSCGPVVQNELFGGIIYAELALIGGAQEAGEGGPGLC